MARLVLYPGSLLDFDTDVIVNPANSSLTGGGALSAGSTTPPSQGSADRTARQMCWRTAIAVT